MGYFSNIFCQVGFPPSYPRHLLIAVIFSGDFSNVECCGNGGLFLYSGGGNTQPAPAWDVQVRVWSHIGWISVCFAAVIQHIWFLSETQCALNAQCYLSGVTLPGGFQLKDSWSCLCFSCFVCRVFSHLLGTKFKYSLYISKTSCGEIAGLFYGWREGSVVKSGDCSYIWPGFDSQHSHSS